MMTSLFDADGVLRGQDYQDISEWKLTGLIRDQWIEGDEDERWQIDQRLERLRSQQYANQASYFTF